MTVEPEVRDDVLGALALIEGVIASPAVKDVETVVRLCSAAAALRRANEKLRPADVTDFIHTGGKLVEFPARLRSVEEGAA